MGYPATPISVRFADKYEPDPNSGCWLWTAALDRYGYGRIQLGESKTLKSHRVSYELHVGPIPEGQMICHRCDTPSCVNPNHLFAGPAAVNVADMIAKKRHRAGTRPLPGEENGRAKLTQDEAVSILLLSAQGGLKSARSEALLRGLHPSCVQRLLRGKSWKYLPRAEAALIALYGQRQALRVEA